jgi:hypothetical protein
MTVNEIINLNAQVVLTETNNDGTTTNIPIINLYATFDGTNMNATVGSTTIDATKAADPTNAATIKTQYQQFMTTVSDKATSLGFVLFTA